MGAARELLLKHDLFSVVQRKTQLVNCMLNEKSCGAVVYSKASEANFLILQYEAGHWDFVKGNVEEGETEQETVVRELREETGITEAHFVGNFKEKITYFYKRQGNTVYKEVVFFLMESDTKDVTISFEHIGYTWLPYEQAMEKLSFKNARDVLKKAREYMKTQKITK
jgi:bis(5'-nucleosidyl)-tetraphosphatase